MREQQSLGDALGDSLLAAAQRAPLGCVLVVFCFATAVLLGLPPCAMRAATAADVRLGAEPTHAAAPTWPVALGRLASPLLSVP